MIRTLAKSLYLSVAGNFKKPSKATHFLNGHFVCPNELAVDEQRIIFRKFIQSLQKNAVIVDPAVALQNMNQKVEPMVCLTFDDGFADVSTSIAPVLDEQGIKGLFFVNPEFIGLKDADALQVLQKHYLSAYKKNFLTRDELLSLNDHGHSLGSHTWSHVRLSAIQDNQILHNEIVASKMYIESLTQKPCEWFAYPFGTASDINEKALQLALTSYPYVFSSIKGKSLFSFNERVINRRHAEGNWPINHVNYFLSGRA